MQGFGAKRCAGIWWKNLYSVLVQKGVKFFGVKCCAWFWCKKLYMFFVQKACSVLVQKAVKGFVVESCAVRRLYWTKNYAEF